MSAECAAFAKLIAGRAIAGTTDWKSTVAALEKHGAVIAFEDDEGLDPFTPAAEQVERMFALAATKVKLPANAAAWFDTHEQIDLATRWVQKKIGNALSAYKAAAIQLDLRDEHHTAMTVVPWASLDKVKAAAKAAGGRVISRSPTKPLAKPLPAAKLPASKLVHVPMRGDPAFRLGTADGVVCRRSRDSPGATTTSTGTSARWPGKRSPPCHANPSKIVPCEWLRHSW